MKKFFAIVFFGAIAYILYEKQDLILEHWNNLSNKKTTTVNDSEIPEKKTISKPLPPRPKKSLRFKNEYLKAQKIPKSKTKSINELADYINQNTKTDLEKARVIYSWIAQNISYDDKGYNTGKYGDLSAEGVLKSRKAVCEGYSNLFEKLSISVGLKAIKVIGYAKGYGYKIGEQLNETDHAWNAIKIDNEWKLVDVTWGAVFGKTVNGKLKSIQRFDDYWFSTPSNEFIYKHLPENPKHQLLENPISKLEYENLQYVDNDLFDLGFPNSKLYSRLKSNPNLDVPKAYSADLNLIVKSAPLNNPISIDEEFKIEIYCPENVTIAIINEGEWTYLTKKADYFTGTIKPKKGIIQIGYKLKKYEKNYNIILEYKVNKGTQHHI